MEYQLRNNPPAGMPMDFAYCPHCCVGSNSCGGGDTRGTDVWQQWYDASGVAMPELTPGSDFEVNQLMNADHGGQAWVMVACGNEISENVNWTYLERSEFDRSANFLPSNPEIFGWYENMSYTETRKWWLHVPSWFTCPAGTAVGRWLWKTGNSCNDFNNVGFNTKPFKESEWAAVGKPAAACTSSNPPETFISCIDFKVTAPSSPTPTPPTPTPTQAPTPTPVTPTPTPGCVDNHVDCTYWAGMGECEANPGYMLENCPAACGSCEPVPTPAPMPPPTPCVDNHVDCAYWAGLGECEANPGYMLVNCQAACGSCGSGGAASLLSGYAAYKARRSKEVGFAAYQAWRSKNVGYAAYKAWHTGMLARSGDL